MKKNKNVLTYSMIFLSLITVINCIALYWLEGFPLNFPLISYSAILNLYMAYWSRIYFIIPISYIICIILFLSAFAIRKGKIVLPVFSLSYFILDITHLLYTFIYWGWVKDYFLLSRFIQIIIDIYFIIMLIKYIREYKKNKSK